MKSRTILSISSILVILLAGSIVYPGALTKPYSGDSNHYAIAHESSEAFDEAIDYDSVNNGERIAVTDFSEEQRRAFEEAKREEPSNSGWQYVGKPSVCNPALLMCDKYEEFPHPAGGESTDAGHFVVEYSTGDRFIVKIGQAGAEWNLDPIVKLVTKLVVLGPYSIFLAYHGVYAYSGWADHVPEPTLFSMGYGAGLATVVFAYPYFLMFTNILLPSWHLPALAVLTWGVIIAEVCRNVIKLNQKKVASLIDRL